MNETKEVIDHAEYELSRMFNQDQFQICLL
jgi:hypothetical protein